MQNFDKYLQPPLEMKRLKIMVVFILSSFMSFVYELSLS